MRRGREKEEKRQKRNTSMFLVSCIWRRRPKECGRFLQTYRITVEIIGFVITKTLSLPSTSYPLETHNLDKQMDGH